MSDGNGGQGFPQGLIKRVQGGLAKLHQNHHRKNDVLHINPNKLIIVKSGISLFLEGPILGCIMLHIRFQGQISLFRGPTNHI